MTTTNIQPGKIWYRITVAAEEVRAKREQYELNWEFNLPVALHGIFTSTKITQWGIHSINTQNFWCATKPFISYIVFRILSGTYLHVHIEKNKWPPDSNFERNQSKFLQSTLPKISAEPYSQPVYVEYNIKIRFLTQ